MDFPLAGIGSRFLALCIDTLLQLVAALFLFLAVALIPGIFGVNLGGDKLASWMFGLLVLGWFAIQFGYFAFFESIWQGQTPGKRSEHLRVIKDDGSPISVSDAIGRNLLRIVDSLPGFYAVGIISVFCSSRHKRLGDYLAGSIVVHDRPLELSPGVAIRKETTVAAQPVTGVITEPQFQLLETYLARRYDLESELRYRLRGQIMERLGQSLPIAEEDQADPDAFIERLVSDYRNR